MFDTVCTAIPDLPMLSIPEFNCQLALTDAVHLFYAAGVVYTAIPDLSML